MTSKASKLRIKRIQRAGRPRKENVDRYPGGQIKHSERENEVRATVMEARTRVHYLHKTPEKDVAEYGGYTAGRLYLDGKITEEQLKAGNEYAIVIMRYCQSVGIPFPTARAQDLGRVKGFAGEESQSAQERATKATAAMTRLLTILQSCKDGPQVKQTIHNLFVMDEEALRLMPERQLLWLRCGLNELIYQEGLRKYGKSINNEIA